MTGNSFSEIGSFGAIIVPVMVAVVWGGKMLLAWFTKALDQKDVLLAQQQERTDKLVAELVTLMRETHEAHVKIIEAVATLREANGREHADIVECIRKKAVAESASKE